MTAWTEGMKTADEDSGVPNVAVLGLGNVLMEDDALGPHVILALQSRFRFPDGVVVQDLGTPGLDLAPFIMDVPAVILVDTVLSDAPSGNLRLYRKADILKHAPQPRLSPHDPALKETLTTLELSGNAPREVLLVGVVPERTGARVGLSPRVEAAIPAAVEAVVQELERLGFPAEPRADGGEPVPWWEAVAAE